MNANHFQSDTGSRSSIPSTGTSTSTGTGTGKLNGTLSIDLDNAWAYRRAAGHDDWERTDSYLPLAIDRIVAMLGEMGLPITVFLVGRDLQSDSDVDAIGRFDELGHWEVANHSWNHLPWLHTMSPEMIDEEIGRTEHAIEDRFGRRPIGFRGPGFSCPVEVLDVLDRRGYQYDASLFPTSLAPLARAVFMLRSNLRGAEREKAKQLYGGIRSMFLPNQMHRRLVASGAKQTSPGDNRPFLYEIPVTTMPFLRTPIHLTYVTFLATFSAALAKSYFCTALAACRMMGTSPSLLLHPPDFLGQQDAPSLANFPGMKMTSDQKQSITRWALGKFADSFSVHTLADTLPLKIQDAAPEKTSDSIAKDSNQPVEIA